MLTPCHPTGTKKVCFSSHLHHCNSPNTPIFHLPFLTSSQTIGTGMGEISKVSTLFELLGWELFKTRENKACLCGSMEHVCQCVPACTKVCVHHLPLGFHSQHYEHRMLSPVVLVHAQGSFFFPKEFLIGFIALKTGNGRKGDGCIHLSLEIAFMAHNASEAW